MLPAFDVSCSEMLSKWEKIVPLEGCCELDVEPYLQTLTSDAISRTAFGSNFEEGSKIFELQRKLAELVREAIQSIYLPGMRSFLHIMLPFSLAFFNSLQISSNIHTYILSHISCNLFQIPHPSCLLFKNSTYSLLVYKCMQISAD